MTDTTLYEAVITQANTAQTGIDTLASAIYAADTAATSFDTDFDTIEATINSVKAWATQKILEADQEEVMDNFLAELRVVFDKYDAKLEVGDDTTGYGESYGAGETAAGIKLTATYDGVTSVKEIDKTVITSEDLV